MVFSQNIRGWLAFFAVFSLTFLNASLGFADTETMHWGGFPTANGPVAESVTTTYNFLFAIVAGIFVLVQAVLLYVIWRFRRAKNPKSASFSHNTVLEIAWTAIPAVICLGIAYKSFQALDLIKTTPEKGLSVEVIAYQFGWDFDYPDYQVAVPEATKPHPLLSSAGEERMVKDLVVPVNTNVVLHVTSKDVIHSFFIPAMGFKIDAMPGRINYQWFKATREGDFIGQCAELCGSAHAEMFFNVKVVSQEKYLAWVNERRVANNLPALTMADLHLEG